MSEQLINVTYRTVKSFCQCCNQKLPQEEISKEKQFTITKEAAWDWCRWEGAAEYEEDMERMVPEFVYDIIGFYAVDSNQKIIIENNEFEKVKAFILQGLSK